MALNELCRFLIITKSPPNKLCVICHLPHPHHHYYHRFVSSLIKDPKKLLPSSSLSWTNQELNARIPKSPISSPNTSSLFCKINRFCQYIRILCLRNRFIIRLTFDPLAFLYMFVSSKHCCLYFFSIFHLNINIL